MSILRWKREDLQKCQKRVGRSVHLNKDGGTSLFWFCQYAHFACRRWQGGETHVARLNRDILGRGRGGARLLSWRTDQPS